jgi:Holliday junction DNA helicase RuvB
VEGDGRIDLAIARRTLERLSIDDMGLDEMDRRILGAVANKFSGGPVGVDNLATRWPRSRTRSRTCTSHS